MNYTLNCNGQLMSLGTPQVMGILNATPDSFFAGSRKQTEAEIADRARQIMAEGGSIVDVGGFSTRPGAKEVSEAEERERLRHALTIVRREVPDAILSIDTFRPDIARMAVEEFGAHIINDVSEGGLTGIANTPQTKQQTDVQPEGQVADVPQMFRTVARLGVAYVLMSVQPTLGDMLPRLAAERDLLHSLGQKDIIVDPGFGFGKTLEQNYSLLNRLEQLQLLDLPILVGLSRKSMVYRLLECEAAEALNGTTALHTIALLKGASILRVHDVRQAMECVKIVKQIK